MTGNSSEAAPLVTIGPKIGTEDATRLHRIYDSVSKNIERENSLISFRIGWAIILSGGIVASESFIASYVKDHYGNDLTSQLWAQLAIVMLSLLAGFFCFMSRRGVRAAQQQMDIIKQAYEANRKNLTELGFPQPYGKKSSHRAGNYNAIVFPVVLLIFWICFSGVQVYRLGSLWFKGVPAQVEMPVARKLDELAESLKAISAKIDALKMEAPKIEAAKPTKAAK